MHDVLGKRETLKKKSFLRTKRRKEGTAATLLRNRCSGYRRMRTYCLAIGSLVYAARIHSDRICKGLEGLIGIWRQRLPYRSRYEEEGMGMWKMRTSCLARAGLVYRKEMIGCEQTS